MSTTDTRAAFKAWAEREGYDTAHTHDGIKWLWLNPMTADLSKAYQAATEAAKATGTAGEQWKPKALQGPRKSIFYGGNTNEHLNPLVVLISAEDYEKCCSLCEAPMVPHEMAYTVGGVADVSYVNGWNDCRDTILGKISDDPTNAPVSAARQPAPVVAVTRIDTGYGNYLEFERKTTGKSGWLVRTESGDLVRALNPTEVLLVDSALAATAAPVLSEADERDNEIFELQKALAFWLPQVNQFMSDEMSQRIARDAYMLVIDGNLPDDFKTAQELGWILPATGKVQRDAEMVCGNCMEPIPTTVMDTSSTRAPEDALSDESIDELAKPLMEQCVIVYGDMRRFARTILAATNRSQP